MLNKTIVQGRLVKDPDLRRTPNGAAVCSFTVAWSETVKDRENTLFLDCVAWQGTAELLCKYFIKGKELVVEGKLGTRKWQDKDGNNRTSTELTVDRVHFCGKKENSGDNYGGYAGSYDEIEELAGDDDIPF